LHNSAKQTNKHADENIIFGGCNKTGLLTFFADLICPGRADIVLALDESTSIVLNNPSQNNWYVRMLGFATNIVRAFSISPDLTQIGVLTYSNNARVRFYLNRYRNSVDVIAAISRLRITLGDTNIADSLRTARTELFSRQHGARPGVPKILILITDGTANIEERRTIPEADETKAAGIQIFTVGIGSQIKEDQLRSIATLRSYFYFATNFATLYNILPRLVNDSCGVVASVSTMSSSTIPTVTTAPDPGPTGIFYNTINSLEFLKC